MNKSEFKLAVMVSGGGTNLQAIIDAVKCGSLDAVISLVVSDNKNAFGLRRAVDAGIPAAFVDPEKHTNIREYDEALIETLIPVNPELIVLAGFMRILGPGFLDAFRGRVINIHPSLLPDYKGLNTHQRVIDAGEQVHGATVHFVTEKLDDGPIVLQSEVAVNRGDDASTLQRRVLNQEHILYPRAIQLIIEGKINFNSA